MAKVYAVRKGHQSGIFDTWAECQRVTSGFPKAEYKSFKTREEAEAYLSGNAMPKPKAVVKTSSKASTSGDVAVVAPFDFPIRIFTDGACEPNPGASGSGLAVYEYNELKVLKYGYYNPQGTNNTAELIALREALKIAPKYVKKGAPVEIFSDSQYALKAVFLWSPKWAVNDWKNTQGEPVKNVDLIKECVALAEELKGKVQVSHVAAHRGTEGNEIADRLAMQASINNVTSWDDYRAHSTVDDILKLARG